MRKSLYEEMLLDMICKSDNFEMTNKEISELIQLQPKSISVMIRRLAKSGKIERKYRITTLGTVRQLIVLQHQQKRRIGKEDEYDHD
ncbi:helix-turn-helix domain-containing protein [Merdibacter massiliensis]|uniref:hypothetical protein n=1 Tax=Merdibacter massiliensis TaxID=1871030 RepID=UPI00096A241F|nr:hypothetical protein [Merdibacter massiliensis]